MLKDLPKDAKILEVGCNIGRQLVSYQKNQKMGFTNLYGIQLQHYAVEKAKEITTDINIIQGSGFDLPFKDANFDLVCILKLKKVNNSINKQIIFYTFDSPSNKRERDKKKIRWI